MEKMESFAVFGPPESIQQTVSRSVQLFCRLKIVIDRQTDRQTDHATRSVTISRIYLCIVRRCGLKCAENSTAKERQFAAGLKTAAQHTNTLECGPMPNVMASQPNIGGALCESSVIPFLVPCRNVWLRPAAGVPCSNAANIRERKTWTQSEFCTCQNSARGQKPPKMYI